MSTNIAATNGKAKRSAPVNGRPHKSPSAPPRLPLPEPMDWPPENPEAEMGLLASLYELPELADDPEIAAVVPGDFAAVERRIIYRHMKDAHLAGQSYDTIPARLSSAGEWSEPGVKKAITEALKAWNKIKSTITSGSDARYFAGQILEAAARRKWWEASREIDEQVRRGLPADDIAGFVGGFLESTRRNPSGQRFKKMTAAELDAISDDLPYIVPNVVPVGQPGLCIGGSKLLKTSVLCDLTLSSCWKSRFLGYFPVERSVRAWFLSGESGDRIIRETCKRIAAAAGRDFASTADYFYSATLPQLGDAADVAELGREIAADGITLLVLDPAYLCMDLEGREGSLFAVGKMLRRITEVCAKHNCTLIIVHHANQSKQRARDFSPPKLHDASWAGFEQYARWWILLGRREEYRDGSGEHRLWLSTGGSAGHGGLYHLDVDEGTRETPGGRFWAATVRPSSQAEAITAERRAAAESERDQQRREEHRQKIIEALRQCPRGETRRVLRQTTKLNEANFTEAAQSLLRDGTIEH